jgi:hypothetical protein
LFNGFECFLFEKNLFFILKLNNRIKNHSKPAFNNDFISYFTKNLLVHVLIWTVTNFLINFKALIQENDELKESVDELKQLVAKLYEKIYEKTTII